MTLPQFADHYRLKLVHDECGDPIVSGRLGKDSNISNFSDTELAMCWLPDGKKTARSGLWKHTKAACIAAGMTMHQDGDAEGILTFDPDIPEQAKTALKSVKAKAKRQMTPERWLTPSWSVSAIAWLQQEKCCKSGGISGNFGGTGADLRPLGALRMKIIHNVANRRGGCKIGTVFEVKMEVPVKTKR